MESFSEFDNIQWLEKCDPSRTLDIKKLQPVLEFTLIWGVFENKICGGYAQVHSIKSHVSLNGDCGLLVKRVSSHLTFLRQYYRDVTSMDDLAHKLLSSGRENYPKYRKHIPTIYELLRNKSLDDKLVLFALLFIAYRVRNNLFHGEKMIYELQKQGCLLTTLSSILTVYMDVSLCNR